MCIRVAINHSVFRVRERGYGMAGHVKTIAFLNHKSTEIQFAVHSTALKKVHEY